MVARKSLRNTNPMKLGEGNQMLATISNILVLFSSLIISSIAVGTTQESNSTMEYFHRTYEGKIAAKYAITMDLKKNGNVLAGSYQYKGKSGRLELVGTIDTSGKFSMNEHANPDYSKSSGVFSGIIAGDTIKAVWSSPDGLRKLDVEVVMTSEAKLKSKEEVLRQAIGTYYLESVGGAIGANGMFNMTKNNGVWKYTGSAISGGMRTGYENALSKKERSSLNSTRITVDSALTTRLIVQNRLLLEIPYNEKGMLYDLGEITHSVLAEAMKKLSPSTIYIEDKLYLAALQNVDYSNDLPIEVTNGMLTLNFSPKSNSFAMHIATSCCDNNLLIFSKHLGRNKFRH